MPGPHKDTYATTTLSICIFTTVICGGMTKQILDVSGMKRTESPDDDIINAADDDDDDDDLIPLSSAAMSFPMAQQARQHVYHGLKAKWQNFDNKVLKVYFGGLTSIERDSGFDAMNRGDYELTTRRNNCDGEGNENDNDYTS